MEVYFNTIIREGLYSNRGNLQFLMDRLFKGINFNGKRVLDIGGGSGVFSFYAAFCGAREVVCLEPVGSGSSQNVIDNFNRLSRMFKCNNVTIEPLTIQDFKHEGQQFDIILCYNSINHLDEKACENLLNDKSAKDSYKKIFEKLYSLSNKSAKLIICDCSRYNFFALFRVCNPVAPYIEWQKHQAPETWVQLMIQAGFSNPVIKWSSFNTLGQIGKVFLGNKLMSFFLDSHFCLTMDKT